MVTTRTLTELGFNIYWNIIFFFHLSSSPSNTTESTLICFSNKSSLFLSATQALAYWLWWNSSGVSDWIPWKTSYGQEIHTKVLPSDSSSMDFSLLEFPQIAGFLHRPTVVLPIHLKKVTQNTIVQFLEGPDGEKRITFQFCLWKW